LVRRQEPDSAIERKTITTPFEESPLAAPSISLLGSPIMSGWLSEDVLLTESKGVGLEPIAATVFDDPPAGYEDEDDSS
jgi:hypothetical protein